jgi:hypothetical protein
LFLNVSQAVFQAIPFLGCLWRFQHNQLGDFPKVVDLERCIEAVSKRLMLGLLLLALAIHSARFPGFKRTKDSPHKSGQWADLCRESLNLSSQSPKISTPTDFYVGRGSRAL